MLRVGICDSSETDGKQTANILFHVLFNQEEIQFTFYDSGIPLVQELTEERFAQDLLIIDPILPDINGLRILQFLRSQGRKTDIIMQTEAIDLAVAGYRYNVFDFIKKPASIQEMEQIFNRYVTERLEVTEESLLVSIQGCFQRIQLGRVYFFESRIRKIGAVMEGEVVEFYRKMDELCEQLPEHEFIRCHQSYIVNRNYVSKILPGELLMRDGKKVPVSRKYVQRIRHMIEENIIPGRNETGPWK